MAGEIILVVDDYEANLTLVRLILTQGGYQVSTAIDAEHALDVLQSLRPALILMDIQLPGMDGLELTRRLKADPATESLLIIAFSAYALKGDEERFRAAGCDGYIPKPIDTRTLASQIQQCLHRK
jgi:two-component system, cell cycle response regulator DivK